MTLSLACQSRCLAGHVSVFAAEHFGSWDDSLDFEEGQQRPQNPIDGGTNRKLYVFHKTWNNPTMNETSTMGTGTPRSMRTSHCNWNWTASMSDLKKPVRQIVNRSGVPKAFWTGHWMKWWISVRCMDFIPHMAVAGTWLLTGQCAKDRWSSLLQCLFQHPCDAPEETPGHWHDFWGRLQRVLLQTWGSWGLHAHYHILRAGSFSLLTLFAPVLIALHALIQPWAFEFYQVCWPQFPFLSSGRALTPTTSYAWQRTSCAWVLLFQET